MGKVNQGRLPRGSFGRKQGWASGGQKEKEVAGRVLLEKWVASLTQAEEPTEIWQGSVDLTFIPSSRPGHCLLPRAGLLQS